MTNKSLLSGEYALFSDFDGTITLLDSNAELVRLHGNERNKRDEALFCEGKATNREVLLRHYRTMRISAETYYNLLHSIPLDPSFARFYTAVKAAGGGVTVLTGSAEEGVRSYLRGKGFGDITVYGNRLEIEDGVVSLYCADEAPDTLCGEGPCAHCKSARLAGARGEGKKVIYIGDGLTDLCAAGYADLLFAKGELARFCEENGISFVPFHSFGDVFRYFFGDREPEGIEAASARVQNNGAGLD